MSRAMSAMGGKGANTISHVDRATAASRTHREAKPRPALLAPASSTSRRQPLKITTAAPTDTYWSVALYAANTDNFYVLNDTQAKGQPATIILVGQGQTVPAAGGGHDRRRRTVTKGHRPLPHPHQRRRPRTRTRPHAPRSQLRTDALRSALDLPVPVR